ncbi:MAG: hypothetical protein ACXIUL_09055 [Wenzhouxiangella sp.]
MSGQGRNRDKSWKRGLLAAMLAMTMTMAMIFPGRLLAAGPDWTERLVDLGNKPAESRQRGDSRNVWDLQAFDGRVYLGMGSTARDTGPIPVWAWDHEKNAWIDEPEAVIEQEAIELFRVFDGVLYIPSADPTSGTTDASKFYRRRADGRWVHVKSSRRFMTAHIRDIALYNDELIGVGNSRRPHDLLRARTGTVALPASALAALEDIEHDEIELPLFRSPISLLPPEEGGGVVDPDTTQRNRMANWFFAVFELHDGLYASTRWLGWAADYPEPIGAHWPRPEFPPQVPPFPTVVRWDPVLGEWRAPPPDALHRLVPHDPDRDPNLTLRPFKPMLFGELWFAPMRRTSLFRPSYLSEYNQSGDFIVKPADGPGRRLVLPAARALGEAVLVHDDRLYVLANEKTEAGDYWVRVYSLGRDQALARHLDAENGFKTDLWRLELRFRHSNLARSFARIDRSWYFGLGFAHGDPVGAAGSLLRLDLDADHHD